MSYKYKSTRYNDIYSYTTATNKKMYRVRTRVFDGKEQSEVSKQGFKTLAAARAYKREVESNIHNGTFERNLNKNRTFEDQWESYKTRKLRRNLWNRGTLNTNTGRFNIWARRFKDTPIKNMTENMIEDYILELYDEEDYSQATMKGFFGVFNQIIDDAVRDKYIPYNPFKDIPFEKPGGWVPKNKVLDLDEFQSFMELARKEMQEDVYRCLYLITFGLRRSEAYGITQSALTFLGDDLTQIDIVLSRTADYPEGKDVKSRDSNRIVVVDEVATQLLKEQIQFARQIKAKRGEVLHKNDFIFISSYTGNPFNIELLNKHINIIGRKLDMEVSPHMFRHTFATYALAMGVDNLQLQKYLGHADVDMTSHYVHASVEGAENIMTLTKEFRKH